MSEPLRAGVVGVGHLGKHHARIYAALPGVRLVGVVDVDRDRAGAIAAEYGAEVFDSVGALAQQIQVASVATPTRHHAEVALPLLDAGVSVLVEKPIAETQDDALRMIEQAQVRDVRLMVGHTERFQPAVAALLARLRDPRFVEIHRLAPFVPRSLDVDVVLDLMIHDLDLSRLLLGGSELTLLDASGTPALTERVDIATARLRFGPRKAANLTASRVSPARMRRIRVFERGAYYLCDTAEGTLELFRVGSRSDGGAEIERELVDVPREEPLRRELAAFVEAVRQRSVPPCSGEDGLAALRLAQRIIGQIERDLD